MKFSPAPGNRATKLLRVEGSRGFPTALITHKRRSRVAKSHQAHRALQAAESVAEFLTAQLKQQWKFTELINDSKDLVTIGPFMDVAVRTIV